jgi:hypothetical protein
MGSPSSAGTSSNVVCTLILSLSLSVTLTASACAARFDSMSRSHEPKATPDIQAQFDRELALENDTSDGSIDRRSDDVRRMHEDGDDNVAAARARTAGAMVRRPPFPSSIAAHRPRIVRHAPLARPFVGLIVVTGLLLFLAWRVPSAPSRGTPPRAPSPRDVVCLACPRCNRVVDLPRHRLSRQLFCPRCGSTLPRDV